MSLRAPVLVLLALLGLTNPSWAELSPYNFESIPVSTFTVVGFTASKLTARSAPGPRGGGTTRAYCSDELFPIRWRVDGTSPTASVGHLLYSSGTITLDGYAAIQAARFLGVGSTTGTLNCTYFTGEQP
jgi:hypothetical protein